MSAIDIHTHAFPDDVAKKAIPQLQAAAPWKAVGKGTVASLLKSMDAADVDLSVICSIATKPAQVQSIFDWCRKIRSDRIDPFPSVHPQSADAKAWLRRFADEGFVGIKLHPMYQDYDIDDPRMDEIYGTAAELGLVVESHCGHDAAFPQDERANPERIRRVIDRHKGLTFVATHMGGWTSWDQVEKHLLGCDVWMETSFTLKWMGPERLTDFIRRHGADKVLFGTDWPWASQIDEVRAIKALDLTDDQKRKILSTNAGRLLKI